MRVDCCHGSVFSASFFESGCTTWSLSCCCCCCCCWWWWWWWWRTEGLSCVSCPLFPYHVYGAIWQLCVAGMPMEHASNLAIYFALIRPRTLVYRDAHVISFPPVQGKKERDFYWLITDSEIVYTCVSQPVTRQTFITVNCSNVYCYHK